MEVNGDTDNGAPSLPSNYVTIHDLKQRWLQQQNHKPSSSTRSKLNPKSNGNDAATKSSNDAVSRSRKELKSPPPLPEVKLKVLDDSKTLIRVSTNNNHRSNEERSQQQQSNNSDSNKELRNRNGSRAPRNPRVIADRYPVGGITQPQPEQELVEDMKKKGKKKKKHNRNRNSNEVEESSDETALVVVDQNVIDKEIKQPPVRAGEGWNWTRKKVRESKEKMAPVVVDQNAVDEKIKQPPMGANEHRYRNLREVRESKEKMAPVVVVDQNVDDEIKQQQEQVRAGEGHNRYRNRKEARGSKDKMAPVVADHNVVDEVVVVAAAVKENNVGERNSSYRRRGVGSGFGGFKGSTRYRPPQGKMWVKKGEYVPN